MVLAPANASAGLPPNLELAVEGWPRFVALAPLLAAPPPYLPPNPAAPLRVHHVLPSPYGDPQRWAPPLAASVRYHHALGFAPTLLYANADVLPALLAHPTSAPLVAERLLTVVEWHASPDYVDPALFGCLTWYRMAHTWKVMHALLSAWGDGNARLLIADLDEVLATPHRTSVSDLLTTGCLSGATSWPLARYNVFRAPDPSGAPRTSPWLTPLDQLTLRSPHPHKLNKVLLDPADSYAPWMHEAVQCAGPPPPTLVPANYTAPAPAPCAQGATLLQAQRPGPECAFLVHNGNLFHVRAQAPNTSLSDASWLWPLSAPVRAP